MPDNGAPAASSAEMDGGGSPSIAAPAAPTVRVGVAPPRPTRSPPPPRRHSMAIPSILVALSGAPLAAVGGANHAAVGAAIATAAAVAAARPGLPLWSRLVQGGVAVFAAGFGAVGVGRLVLSTVTVGRSVVAWGRSGAASPAGLATAVVGVWAATDASLSFPSLGGGVGCLVAARFLLARAIARKGTPAGVVVSILEGVCGMWGAVAALVGVALVAHFQLTLGRWMEVRHRPPTTSAAGAAIPRVVGRRGGTGASAAGTVPAGSSAADTGQARAHPASE